jgi:UDP-glucose 4-epimerase
LDRVLITGGSGFIGTHLAERLVAAGYRPRLFDLHRPETAIAGCEVVTGDMTRLDEVATALEACQAVVHLGAISRVGAVNASPYTAVQANILGTATVIEAARLRPRPPAILLASSVEVTLTPDGAYGFTNLYGITKAASELLTHCYARDYGLRVLALRFAHLYGSERDKPDKVPRVFVERALRGEPLNVNAAAGTFDFLHIDDAIGAILKGIDWLGQAADGSYAGVPVVTGIGMTLPEVVDLIMRETGTRSAVHIDHAGSPREAIENDPEEAFRLIGFRAAIMVEQGIRSLVARLRPATLERRRC